MPRPRPLPDIDSTRIRPRVGSLAAVLVAGALVVPGRPALLAAQAGDPPALSPGRVAAQVATGAVGTPVGFFAAGILTDWAFERLGRDDRTTSRLALAAGWTGAAFATAAGPALVGARGPGSGRYPAAVAGAVAGGLASWAVVRLVDRDGGAPPRGGRVGATVAGIATFLLPSVGATLGYDLSRRRP
jgi:hypothetical protein